VHLVGFIIRLTLLGLQQHYTKLKETKNHKSCWTCLAVQNSTAYSWLLNATTAIFATYDTNMED